MNRKALASLKTVLTLKKDADAAALVEKNRFLALAHAQKEKLCSVLEEARQGQMNLDIWEQTQLESWISVMQKRLLQADAMIQKREAEVELARQTLLRSNGEVKGIKHLLR